MLNIYEICTSTPFFDKLRACHSVVYVSLPEITNPERSVCVLNDIAEEYTVLFKAVTKCIESLDQLKARLVIA